MEERQIIKREEIELEKMSLEEAQVAEQLYGSAGLGPVVDAGLKDYGKRLQREDKLLNKVLGPRGSDMKGYGEAVAKRVAFAVYSLLNKQYGGKVGDLRSYIMTLEDERERANMRYDELMGRVIGILGDEYKDLRTDSKEFMERLTGVLGENLKDSKIDHGALAERLADIDGLRSQIQTLHQEQAQLKEKHESQIKTLHQEQAQLKEKHESQIAALKNEHSKEVESLSSQIANLDANIKELESEKTTLTGDLAQLRKDYDQLKTAITTVAGAIPYEEIRGRLGEELYTFLLKDSKVPNMVIDGVGKFIDFKKYLGIAVERGGKEASKHAEEILGNTLKTVQ